MPVFSPEQGVQLEYNLHTEPLDLSKPTLLFLHPTSLDSTFLEPQYTDDRLRSLGNLVTVNDRHGGQSSAPFDPAYDSWVQAADVAKLIRHLGLPPVHLFASQSGATRCAVRLAVLFPDLIASLCYAGIVVDILHTPTKGNSFYDTFNAWATARNEAEVDAAVRRWAAYMLGDEEDGDAPPEKRQQFVTFLKQRYSPDRPEELVAACQTVFNRHAVPKETIMQVGKPTLLFWGTANGGCPAMVAISMSHRWKSKTGPAKLQIIDGAPNLVCFTHPQQVNAHLADFVKKHHNPSQRPVQSGDDKAYFESALKRLGEVLDEPEMGVAHRDPLSSMSFSALHDDKIKEIEALKSQWIEARMGIEASGGGGATRGGSGA